MWRHRSESLFEILHHQAREIREFDTPLEGAELRSRLALVPPVQRTRSAHDVHTFEIGLQRQREIERTAEVEWVDQTGRIGEMAARGGERIKHRRRAAEEDVPVAAHEVNDDVSYQDEQIDTLVRVFQTQEVEIRALIFRSREPDKIKVFRVEVHTLPEAFGEQLRQLSCPDHRELVIGPRRVQDEYLLRAVGFLRVREQGRGRTP